ncbi:hypothetical protein CSUI_003226 [Cystoisospora suis]|uniref:Transmembrane protein n=1 Tax=Cystoisospora suis TaxID=483139 RepID=A0A2C6L3H1_9APIC|nr:hypothetical protein CSUI_003226 [Cystoisospora suis]
MYLPVRLQSIYLQSLYLSVFLSPRILSYFRVLKAGCENLHGVSPPSSPLCLRRYQPGSISFIPTSICLSLFLLPFLALLSFLESVCVFSFLFPLSLALQAEHTDTEVC